MQSTGALAHCDACSHRQEDTPYVPALQKNFGMQATFTRLMKMRQSFQKAKVPLYILVVVAIHLLAVVNVWNLSRDMIYGDHSAEQLIPMPRNKIMRVPDNDLTRQYEAQNRIAADFAQIYFPSRNLSLPAYTRESTDPWHRPSRYAPVLHKICAATICKLDYGPASALHILIQLTLFYVSFLYVFKILHIGRHVIFGITLANACLFLTPVGLSWFERGQYTLYVSIGYLWLFLGLMHRNYFYIVVSAIFSYIKLTSLPFVFVVLCLRLIYSRNRETLMQGLKLSMVYGVTTLLLFMVNFDDGVDFLSGVYTQEIRSSPDGISMAFVLPTYVIKGLPLLLVALGYALALRCKRNYISVYPFLIGACILLLLYPTKAYDYNIPSLLIFIPFTIWWAGLPQHQPGHSAQFIKQLFFLFLIVSSCLTIMNPQQSANSHLVFLGFGTIFILAPFFSSTSGPTVKQLE